jgi:hypothetical protein
MIETTRDPQNECQGLNCPGLHIDREAGTATFEGAVGQAPAGLTAGPGEGLVTLPLDVARRIVAAADL